MASTNTNLSIYRIATFQQYTVPLVVLTDTSQQTAVPFLQGLVFESIRFGRKVILVCTESTLGPEIACLENVSIVDKRQRATSITAMESNEYSQDSDIDFDDIRSTIQNLVTQYQQDHTEYCGCVVVFDSLFRLLQESVTSTLVLLSDLRKIMDAQSRVLVRYSRDVFSQTTANNGSMANSSPYLLNSINGLADVAINVYPIDSLKTWMPGWYSDGTPTPFVSPGHNDPTRGLIYLEHCRQSGKVGLEVGMFELSNTILKFNPIRTKSSISPSLSYNEDSNNSALDPTANLSFNLGLTEKQRQDKANVELPYLEAQMENLGTSNNGGEIHYQMDEEDDWDEDDPDDDLEI